MIEEIVPKKIAKEAMLDKKREFSRLVNKNRDED